MYDAIKNSNFAAENYVYMQIMSTIRISKSNIELKVSVYVYLDTEHPDKDVYVAYCPELNLVGCGHGEEEAKQSFEWVMKDYIEEMVKENALEDDLLKMGWTKRKDGGVNKPTLRAMIKHSRLNDILTADRYSKYSVPVLV